MAALDVRCPTCGRPAGEPCISVHAKKLCRKPHRQRETQARLLSEPRVFRTVKRRYAKERRWQKARTWTLDRSGGTCEAQIVGVCHGVATEAHHIVPRSRGGGDDLGNLLAVCGPGGCHDYIHAHPTWASERGLLRSRAA